MATEDTLPMYQDDEGDHIRLIRTNSTNVITAVVRFDADRNPQEIVAGALLVGEDRGAIREQIKLIDAALDKAVIPVGRIGR